MSAIPVTMLTLALLAGEPATSGVVPMPGTSEPALESAAVARPYIVAALGGGAMWQRDVGREIVGPALTFGVEAGALLADRGRLRIGIGGAFNQTGHGPAGSRWPNYSTTGLLAKVRVGGFGSRVWGYGIGGLGTSIATEDGGDYFALDAGPAGLLGAGLQLSFRNGTSLGFEADAAVAYQPAGGLLAGLSGSVLFGWRFGAARPNR